MWLPLVSLYLVLMMSGEFAHPASAPRPDRQANSGLAGHLPEPPVMILRIGDPAPNFSFEGYDGRWMRLHHLLDQGPVLLVFGARERELRRLRDERGRLLDLGVVPVVVLDDKPGTVRALAKRLDLRYTVLSDPRGVIAGQFNVVENGDVQPAWFVLDQRGRVRGLSREGLPAGEYPRLCARSLALPMPGVAFPTSR
jgi:peroxiredoxin